MEYDTFLPVLLAAVTTAAIYVESLYDKSKLDESFARLQATMDADDSMLDIGRYAVANEVTNYKLETASADPEFEKVLQRLVESGQSQEVSDLEQELKRCLTSMEQSPFTEEKLNLLQRASDIATVLYCTYKGTPTSAMSIGGAERVDQLNALVRDAKQPIAKCISIFNQQLADCRFIDNGALQRVPDEQTKQQFSLLYRASKMPAFSHALSRYAESNYADSNYVMTMLHAFEQGRSGDQRQTLDQQFITISDAIDKDLDKSSIDGLTMPDTSQYPSKLKAADLSYPIDSNVTNQDKGNVLRYGDNNPDEHSEDNVPGGGDRSPRNN